MPKARNRTYGSSSWGTSQWPGKKVFFRSQKGFDSYAHESKTQVLDYTGWSQVGEVTEWFTPRPVPSNVSFALSLPGNGAVHRDFTSLGGIIPGSSRARSKAYAKFREAAVGTESAVGVLAAERREGYRMIANRAMGLVNSYRHLRRGNFREALKSMSVDPKRKHRSVVRTAAHEASGLWLEYWFGWSPSVNDIYGVTEVLTQDLPGKAYSGTSGFRFNKPYRDMDTQPNYDGYETGLYLVKTGATVRLVNPDLFLLNQLGLLNPATIAWEVVPFSFVVDWFTNLGSVIQATSDWVGLEVTDPYRTYVLKDYTHYHRAETSSNWNQNRWVGVEYKGAAHIRRKGLQYPVPTYPRLLTYGNSKTRAATAVSLLTSLFIGK